MLDYEHARHQMVDMQIARRGIRDERVLEASLATEGVERLPDKLLDLGLAERIDARGAGPLAVPPQNPRPIPRPHPERRGNCRMDA